VGLGLFLGGLDEEHLNIVCVCVCVCVCVYVCGLAVRIPVM